MKKDKIIYWTATTFVFLFEGVMPALTGHTELAKEGIRNLGYPEYFGVMLTVAKVMGSLALIIPAIPKRVKEWAYAGLTFELVAAFISHWAVDGLNALTFFPIFILAVLMVSYIYFHKLNPDPGVVRQV
ncbi:DoxX family protein [Cognataquiflexum aquatile]|uniref:DoxX family protein n=1 Tax=Cognataquiflexum aquatile TaxID=2249427 RepID=UPI000DEA1CB3|nr:DoxX family protein [Cognataquiflexum aquatile]